MSNWNDDLLFEGQTEIKARLENDAFFSDIKVMSKREGVTENDVAVAVGPNSKKADKTGACCIVLMPNIPETEGESPGPSITIEFGVQVIEARAHNNLASVGTRKPAEQIAANVLNLLHLYSPFHLGQVLVSSKTPIAAFDTGVAGWTSYIVTVRMQTGFTRTNKVGNPSSSSGGGLITLTCATPDAAIYYTLDGSYPGPANANATLFTVPFNPGAAPLLRAVAYRTNFIPSDSASWDIA